MIEGGGSKTMSKTKEWLEKNPKDVHKLLSLLTRVIVDYLVMQVINFNTFHAYVFLYKILLEKQVSGF